MNKILVIDDEKIIRDRLKKILDIEGYNTYIARDGIEGLALFKKNKPDVAIIDIKMPGMNGIEVLKEIKKTIQTTEIIMVSGHGSVDTAIESLNAGAFSYIVKPIEFDELEIKIQRALQKQKTKNDLIESEERLNLAQEAAGIGSWDWNIEENTLIWSDKTFCQFGLKPNEVKPTYELFESFIHTDDIDFVNQNVKNAIDGKKPYSINARLINKDGKKWIMHAQVI